MEENPIIPEDRIIDGSIVGRVQAHQVQMDSSGAAIINAEENITLESSGGIALIAGRDISVKSGGGQALVAGRDIAIDQGGGQLLVAGNDIRMSEGGGGITIVGNNANVEKSRIGILISSSTNVDADTQVYINTPQAIALGTAFGLAFAALSFILRRRS